MQTMRVHLAAEGEAVFADLQRGEIVHVGNGATIRVTGLDAGVISGEPSVAMAFPLPDGRWALIETSLRMFLTAADMLKARFGDPR